MTHSVKINPVHKLAGLLSVGQVFHIYTEILRREKMYLVVCLSHCKKNKKSSAAGR